MNDLGLILHLPHDSTVIPDDVREQFTLSDAELDEELLAMTDHFTAEIFSPLIDSNQTLRFPVSRLVVDPERFVDDNEEIMSTRGMGVIYTHTSTRAPMRRKITSLERELLIQRFYQPHHFALTALTRATRDRLGRAVILDAHSFPSVPRAYELNQDKDRPDICIGTDSFHTPPALRDAFVAAFKEGGFSVAIDTPFSGALVPTEFYQRDKRVLSIMLEVNRGIYINEATGKKVTNFESIATRIRTCCVNGLNRYIGYSNG